MKPAPAVTFLLSLLALPFACLWVWRQEQRILRDGQPLDRPSLEDARRAGVRHPERVRLQVVDVVPGTASPPLRLLEQRTAICISDAAALTARYGIYLTPEFARDREVITHELTHTAQFERMGGIAPFLWNYITGCLEDGYFHCQMEVEARDTAATIVA